MVVASLIRPLLYFCLKSTKFLLCNTVQGHGSFHNPFPQLFPATTLSPAPGGAAGRRTNVKRLRKPRFITACTDLRGPAYLPPPPRTPVEFSRNLHRPRLYSVSCGWLKRIQPYKGGRASPRPLDKGALMHASLLPLSALRLPLLPENGAPGAGGRDRRNEKIRPSQAGNVTCTSSITASHCQPTCSYRSLIVDRDNLLIATASDGAVSAHGFSCTRSVYR